MTVSTTNSFDLFTGDGVQTIFVGTFPARRVTDIFVYTDAALVPPSSYTVNGDVTLPGWSVTLDTAPGAGAAVRLQRLSQMTQDTVYTPYGQYKAKQHESDFDYSMYLAQEARDLIAQALPALSEISIKSSDPAALAVQDPTLATDVTLVPQTNKAGGLLKLTASDGIPTKYLPPLAGGAFDWRGLWDASGGTTPPAEESGYLYIISTAGTLPLVDVDTGLTVPTSVVVGNTIAYGKVADTPELPADGWYLVGTTSLPGTLPASSVTYDNTASGWTGDNVQLVLDETWAAVTANAQDIAALASALGDLDAAGVPYDPTVSDLTATDVQAAIDELAGQSIEVPPASETEEGVVQLATVQEISKPLVTDTGKVTGPGRWFPGLATDPKAMFGFIGGANPQGHYYLPGGLLLQWGRTSANTIVGNNQVTFPIAFQGNAFAVVATRNLNTPIQSEFGINNITATGFRLNINAVIPGYNWVAVGQSAAVPL